MIFKQLLLVAFISVNTITSIAQKYEWKQATSGGYTYKYVTGDPIATRFYTLKNGLSVILSQNKKEPRVAVRIAVRTGSNNDPSNHTGLAHYLEHLLFKGTDKFGSLDWSKEKPLLDKIDDLYEQYNSTTDVTKRKEIYKEIDKTSGEAAKFSIAGEYQHMMTVLGSQATNAGTFVESTVYQENIPSNAMDKFLTIQAERFRNPVLRIFHTELEAVYEEKNRTLDDDNRKMLYAMLENVFPTTNYGLQSTIGTIEHLKNPSIKAIREYYYKYYVPNNMALVMAGDFNADELVKKIDKQFAYMQPKPVDEYKSNEQKPLDGPIVKEVYGPTAESIRIAYRSAKANTRDAMLADLASAVLSNGKAGLMDLNLNKQQKVLGASAPLFQFKDHGIFFLMASPKEGQSLDDVKALLMQQVDILKKGNFDESLIKAIAANYKLDRLEGYENNVTRADNIADQFIKSKGEKWSNDVAIIDEMSKVTKKELVDFANKFFGDNNYVVIYKRKGEDKSIVKVEKPPITPVETNAGKSSAFVKSITETPLPSLKPVFLDYAKDIQKSKVGNAEILYVQNKENGLFRLAYRFEMGSWNNKLLPFAARYLQYLGTDKYSSEEISKQFYNLACSFNISPGTEQTVITISGLQENFDKAVALFENLLHNCKADGFSMQGMIGLQLKSRANNKLNKAAIASGLQSYAMYGSKNPFNYTLTNDELKGLDAYALVDLLHNLTNYEHTVTYYGPQPLAALTTNLQKLHKLPARWVSNSDGIKFKRTNQTSNKVLFANYDAVQSEIYWVKNLEAYDPKNEALVNMFNYYFGNGMGSVVFQTIRGSKALAYSTYAFVGIPTRKDDNYSVVAYVGSQADKMNEAMAGMNELLDTIPRTEQSLENARQTLLKNTETRRIVQDEIIESYLNAKRKGLDYDLRKDNYAKYSSLTMDNILQYHKHELAKQPYTYCVVASDKKINLDDLKKYGDLQVVNLEELFGY